VLRSLTGAVKAKPSGRLLRRRPWPPLPLVVPGGVSARQPPLDVRLL